MIATATLANTKISAVDGAAFFDVGVSGLLAGHIGEEIFVRDPTGKIIWGYIKAAGTGETVINLVTGDDSTFASDTGFWDIQAGWAITGGKAVRSVAYRSTLNKANLGVEGGLYQYSLDYTQTAGYQSRLLAGNSSVAFSTDGVKSGYITAGSESAIWGIWAYDDIVATVDNLIIDQVLTPSATGVTIVSTSGDTTQSWVYKDPAFNYKSTYFDINIVDQIGFDWRQFTVPYIPVRDLDRIIAAETVRSVNSGRTKGVSVPTRIRGV